jgi:hypothetical protein
MSKPIVLLDVGDAVAMSSPYDGLEEDDLERAPGIDLE